MTGAELRRRPGLLARAGAARLRSGRRAAVLALLVLGSAAAVASAPARAEGLPDPTRTTLELKLLSYNVAGIPLVHARIDERIAAIAARFSDLAPDIVCLQEVWRESDAQALAEGARAAGLEHAHWFARGPQRSGLQVLSRYPITETRFAAYTQNGDGWRVLTGHVDVLSEKGVATAIVESPLGPVAVLNTHLVAKHTILGRRDRVQPQREVQCLELARAADAIAWDVPLFVLGDLNAEAHAPEARLLVARARLRDTYPGTPGAERRRRIDYVLYREPAAVAEAAPHALDVLGGRRLFDAPVEALDGALPLRLSDHPCIEAHVRITRAAPPPREAGATPPKD